MRASGNGRRHKPVGVGPIALTIYANLARQGALKPGQFVLELGSQEMFYAGWPQLMHDFCDAIGKPEVADTSWATSHEFMTALGFHHQSIDIDGRFGAWPYDLNEPLPQSNWGPWDIVTNHGTTEHCFDQAQCFRTMHVETKPGGLMIHCVPMRGYDKHCFYLYKPELFIALAHANGYQVFGIWTAPDAYDKQPVNLKSCWFPRDEPGDILLAAVLRKMSDTAFQAPIQKEYRI